METCSKTFGKCMEFELKLDTGGYNMPNTLLHNGNKIIEILFSSLQIISFVKVFQNILEFIRFDNSVYLSEQKSKIKILSGMDIILNIKNSLFLLITKQKKQVFFLKGDLSLTYQRYPNKGGLKKMS